MWCQTCSPDPFAVAIPYPFASRFFPTFIVSHGRRSLMYSFVVDSIRKAYFPLDFCRRRVRIFSKENNLEKKYTVHFS